MDILVDDEYLKKHIGNAMDDDDDDDDETGDDWDNSVSGITSVNLCRISDPECEACQ